RSKKFSKIRDSISKGRTLCRKLRRQHPRHSRSCARSLHRNWPRFIRNSPHRSSVCLRLLSRAEIPRPFRPLYTCANLPSALAERTEASQETEGRLLVKTVEAAVIGVGWVGGTRADTLARSALVDKLHLCDIKPDRLAEVKALYKPATATLDYDDIIKNPNI